jgi:hypothetical protein
MKQGCLFVFVLFSTDEIHQTGMLQITFSLDLFGNSRGRGVHQLGFIAFGCAVQKFLNIE